MNGSARGGLTVYNDVEMRKPEIVQQTKSETAETRLEH